MIQGFHSDACKEFGIYLMAIQGLAIFFFLSETRVEIIYEILEISAKIKCNEQFHTAQRKRKKEEK